MKSVSNLEWWDMDSRASWITGPIKEIAQLFDGPHATPKTVDNGPIFLGINSLNKGRLVLSNTRHVTEKDYVIWTRRVTPRANDIVFSYETRIGEAAIIPEGLKCCLGRRMALVRTNPNKLDPKFFLYLYLSPKYQEFLRSKTIHGSTVDRLPLTDFPDFPISYPPLSEQKSIVATLSCLDEKIELNQRMNVTLEAIAQALFKSWFVDFDPVKAKAEGREPEGMDDTIANLFPSNFTESSLGLIPEGWSIAEIGDVADVIDCLHSKKPERTNAGRPFLQLNNIRDDGLMDLTDMYLISDEDYKKWVSRIEAQEGDCVITNVGRVGAVAQIPRGLKAALGRNMTAIRTISSFKYPTFLICYLCSDLAKNEITLKEDTGTILNALNVRNIPKLRFFKASKAIHDEFEKLARPIRTKMEQNLAEINILGNTRDLLLPRLLSGKLRVDEIREIVEAAVL